MRPTNLKTKIFLDSGDPAETKQALDLLGFLDGQTTNPTLFTKSKLVADQLSSGKRFSHAEAWAMYKTLLEQISKLIPDGSVSIEVYADKTTTTDHMLLQARHCYGWIPNAHIKFPTTVAGLAAAEQAVKESIRVNMTLCFSQSQAAAVYAATTGTKRGDVLVSPFVGRLTDNGANGLDLVRNIVTMYSHGDRHVEVLAASFRNVYQFVKAIELGADIATISLKLLTEWHQLGMPITTIDMKQLTVDARPIDFEVLDLHLPWQEFDITHPLTDAGLQKFADDWNNLLAQ